MHTKTKHFVLSIIFLSGLAGNWVLAAVNEDMVSKSSHTLWYDSPASKWLEALPVGNGRLGAMVFGGVKNERIQLNEMSLWAGPPVPEAKGGMYDAIERSKELIFEGKHEQADELVQSVLPPRISPRSYQTLGDLKIDFSLDGDAKNYTRELNLDTAIASSQFEIDGISYKREAFVSAVDDVIVVYLTAEKDACLNFTATLSRPADCEVGKAGPQSISISGQASQKGKHKGTKYFGLLSVVNCDGKVATSNDGIEVLGAKSAMLLITAATDYNKDDPAKPLTAKLKDKCVSIINKVATYKYVEIRSRHIKENQRLYRRVDFCLDTTTTSALPTTQRLKAIKNGAFDPSFSALYFNYGRYLLISSSRPGNLPANLQGIWNEHLAAPWNADYHININIQMNYWPSEICNLSECQMPFFDFCEKVFEDGKKTAKDVYHCQGTVAHHTTDPWLFTCPFGKIIYGFWPLGAGWCSSHFMEHYRFTQDRQFLEKRAYPAIKECAMFYLDFLTKNPKTGLLVCGPSTSPENGFKTKSGNKAFLDMGSAMSQQIVWEVFNNALEAAEILNINDDFISKVQNAIEKLAMPQIGPDGRLLEWSEPFEEVELGHRHISHTYAVYPGNQYSFDKTPDEMAAIRKSIDFRLAHGGGYTGWSRAWIINVWARLLEPELAYESLQILYKKSTSNNLFNNLTPFQIDGNFGGTAGIAEMLLQSQNQAIELLPALPKEWNNGKISGFVARGGYEVGLEWKDGKLVRAEIIATRNGNCTIKYGNVKVSFDASKGKKYCFDSNLKLQ